MLLILPDDDRWLFEAEKAIADVEEGILRTAGHGNRPTSQIAVEARFPETVATS